MRIILLLLESKSAKARQIVNCLAFALLSRFALLLFLHVREEEQKAVCYVSLTHTAIKVECEHIKFWVSLFEFLFYTTDHNVIGYTAKGLHRDHICASLFDISDDLGW